MVFANYVRLVPGVPTRLHFTDYYLVQREIADRDTGRKKKIWSHIFAVDRVGGDETATTFSILSQKLWAHLEPYEKAGTFRDYEFIITEMGEGFYKDWNLQVVKIPETSGAPPPGEAPV